MKRRAYRYGKKAFNNAYNTNARNKRLNDNFKANIRTKAIADLRQMDELNDKLNYINNLKYNTYRYGRKYKYDCNFKNWEIGEIVAQVGDEELKQRYPQSISPERYLGGIVFIVIIIIAIISSL